MQRLTVGDLANFWAEGPTTPMHIALAGVLSPGSLVGADGRFDLDAARERVRRRLGRAPPLRRRIRWTRFGEGLPLWVDDDVDVAHHVDAVDSVPMTEAGFLQWCATDALRPLDRDRPLWRMRFVPRVDGRNVGVLVVVHHAVADGLRGVALVGSLLDDRPGLVADDVAPPAALPPERRALVVDQARARLRRLRAAIAALPTLPRRVAAVLRAIATSFSQMRGAAPRTPLAVSIGAGRRLHVVRCALDDVRGAGRARGATINDVVLAAVGSGVRAWTAELGAGVDRPLRVSVPIGASASNAGGVMLVPLPIAERDDDALLADVVASTRAAKQRRDAGEGASWDMPWAPVFLSRLWVKALRRFGRTRVNAYVTNVPGPTEPLFLGDARLVSATPLAPLVAGVALSIAVFSYGGTLTIAVNVDAAVPRSDRIAAGIEAALRAYGTPPRRENARWAAANVGPSA